jgi:hypothetical protein
LPQLASAFAVLDGGGAVIRSSDGRASLSIPAGALPPGVSASSIRIAPLTGTDAPQGPDVLAAYQLEPSGLRFSTPATLQIELPSGGANVTLPVVLNLGADGAEVAEDVAAAFHAARGMFTIRASVPHFSPVVVTQGFISVSIDQPGDQLSGVPFHVGASVGRSSNPRMFTVIGTTYTVAPTGPSFSLYGNFRGSNIQPLPVADPATTIMVPLVHLAGHDFTCGFTGINFRVQYIALIRFGMNVTIDRANGTRQIVSIPPVNTGRSGPRRRRASAWPPRHLHLDRRRHLQQRRRRK